jgi:hypothetical protein
MSMDLSTLVYRIIPWSVGVCYEVWQTVFRPDECFGYGWEWISIHDLCIAKGAFASIFNILVD